MIEFAISGRSVPIAITVIPIKPADVLLASAAWSARVTARRLASDATTSPETKSRPQTAITFGPFAPDHDPAHDGNRPESQDPGT
jgi:hypothetical protein